MKQLSDFIANHANCKEIITATTSVLNRAKIPYALIGSLARMCYIPDVDSTKDADFLLLADKRPALLKLLPQILNSVGLLSRSRADEATCQGGVSPSPKVMISLAFIGIYPPPLEWGERNL